jgi:1,4-alpha-glucan branching enzyme
MIKKVNKRDSDQVKVTFVLPDDHPYGEEVSVVGDFNDWTAGEHPFVRRSNQTYSTNVMLEEGNRYAFRYYSEDEGWINDEEADDFEPNEYGATNCIVET